jgi:hypothetical protein
MAEKNIVVSLDGETLTIDPDSLTIEDGDWLWWRFDGLPEHAFGTIRFGAALGPFQALRSYRDRYVLAQGNLGLPGSFAYTAMVVIPGETGARGLARGEILNAATTENRTPKARVVYHPSAMPGQLGTLTIPPRPLQLFDGDTVIWEIESEGLPVGSYLDLQFTDSKRPTWPFMAVSTVLDPSGRRQIHATGFAVGEDAGTPPYQYLMELRSADGTLLARTDPQIDRLPPPPDGGS